MRRKQKIVHGRGPSNINLASLFAPLMFAGLYNQSPPLTMFQAMKLRDKSKASVSSSWMNVSLCLCFKTSLRVKPLNEFDYHEMNL